MLLVPESRRMIVTLLFVTMIVVNGLPVSDDGGGDAERRLEHCAAPGEPGSRTEDCCPGYECMRVASGNSYNRTTVGLLNNSS